LRCRVDQRRRAASRLQDRELCLPSCMLRQGLVQGQPSTLRDRVQHSRLGVGTTEPVSEGQARSDSARSRQLAKQQPGPSTEESSRKANGQDDDTKGSVQHARCPHGWSRWPRSTRCSQLCCSSSTTSPIQHGHGRSTDAPPPRSPRRTTRRIGRC
jgi:hypothetical protein